MRPARPLGARAVTATLAALALATPAIAAAPAITGKWKTDDGKSVIEFYPCGQKVCGRIAQFLVPEPAGGARDGKNPDAKLRDRKLLGLRIFWDLAPTEDGFKGKGYSPEEGRYFTATVSREGAGLKVKGCVSIFCRTLKWTRA